jgi:hypothetical protein
LTSDLNDTVTTNTNQTVGGNKTFTGRTVFQRSSVDSVTGNTLSDPTQTLNDGVSSGTVAQLAFADLGQKTVTASSATTYTNAATLRVQGAPLASTNVTITNPNAVQIDEGNLRLTNGRILSSALGTNVTPAIAIGALLNDGIYSSGAGNVNIATTGTLRFTANSTNMLSTVPFRGPTGTVTATTFQTNAANSGLYAIAAGNPAIAAGGTNTVNWTNQRQNNAVVGSNTTPSMIWGGDTSTGFYRPAANQLAFTASSIQTLLMSGTGLSVTGNSTTSGNTTTSGLTTTGTLKMGPSGSVVSLMQFGTITVTAGGWPSQNAFQSYDVLTQTFSTPFAQNPLIFLSVNVPSPGSPDKWWTVIATPQLVSTTGFRLTLLKLTNDVLTGTVWVSWIAFQ